MSTESAPPLLRRIVVSLIVIAAALGGGHVMLQRLAALKKEPERSAAGPQLPVVRVERLVRGDHRETLRGYGVARPLREARVSAEVGGIVREVAEGLEVGSFVRPPPTTGNGPKDPRPAPLVRIDRQDLDDGLATLHAQRAQAVAERVRTEADVVNLETQLEVSARRLSTAKTELRRILSLVPDTLPESEADRQRLAVFALEQVDNEIRSRRDLTKASLAVLDAQLDVLDARISKALRDIERTYVYTPYAARVAAKHVEVGALVAPGTPLFDLVDPDTVEVAIALPASRYGQVVAQGEGEASAVALRFHEDEAVAWRGTVARVDPTVDAQARTFVAYAVVEAAGASRPIPPGAHVVADVAGGLQEDVVVVPREAFVEDSVYVVRETPDEGVWEAHEVRPTVRTILAGVVLAEPGAAGEGPAGEGPASVGLASEGLASAGLADGDLVVVTNLEDVAQGSRLRILLSEDDD